MVKRIKHIFIYLVIFLLAGILSIYLLLWIPAVQQKLKDLALTEVTKKTKNKITIGQLDFKPFSHLRLKEVYISDLRGDTLLYTQQLSVDFSLGELLKNKLLINSVQMENFRIRINKENPEADFNFQFFIDAFASTDTTQKKEKSNLVIEIDQITLEKGELSYDILSEPDTSGVFDANHIHIRDFASGISLKSIDPENLDATIESLAFKEKSGFHITNLQIKLSSEGKKIRLEKMALQLPASEMNIDHSFFDYSKTGSGQSIDRAEYELNLDIPRLTPSDLRMFYSPLEKITGLLSLQGKFNGSLPEIKIDQLIIKNENHMNLEITARLNDFNNWSESPLELAIDRFSADNTGILNIIALTGKEDNPDNSYLPDPIILSGNISGSIPNFLVDLHASTSNDRISLTGKGGYILKTGASHFDIVLQTDSFNIRPIIRNPAFGRIDMLLAAKGDINNNGKINATAQLDLHKFYYNNYIYKNIHADASYIRDSISAKIISIDPNLSFEMDGHYIMKKGEPNISVIADLKSIKPDKINILNTYEGAEIRGLITAGSQGLDPENMVASIRIDSLAIKTATGTIREDQISLDYEALHTGDKSIQLKSDMLSGNLQGHFSFDALTKTVNNSLSRYFPAAFTTIRIKKHTPVNLNASFDIKSTEELSQTIGLPFSIVQDGAMSVRYEENSNIIELKANLPLAKLDEFSLQNLNLDLKADSTRDKINLLFSGNGIRNSVDTTHLNISAQAGNGSIDLDLGFQNNTPVLKLSGDILANIVMGNEEKQKTPNVVIQLKPSFIALADKKFAISPASFIIGKSNYAIHHFNLAVSETEFLEINGRISDNESDSLMVNISRIQLQNLKDFLNSDLNIQGEANGQIIFNQLLSAPRFFTKDFSIKDIALNKDTIGTLNFSSQWEEQQKGLFFNGNLKQANDRQSEVSGHIIPSKDSLDIRADIQAIRLEWLSFFTDNFLYGLKGEVGANIQASGKLKNPDLNGIFYLKDSQFGVKMTNVSYSISDSIHISPGNISFNNFQIRDESGAAAKITGNIAFKDFSTFTPKINMDMQEFLVLNNPNQTDSLFYGTLKLNGMANVSGAPDDLLVKMNLSNSGVSKIFFRLPEGAAEAQHYSGITFINPNDTTTVGENATEQATINQPANIPVKLQIALGIDPDLTLGTVINPKTKDEATIKGKGNIDFSYDLNNGSMKMTGDYTINDGQCALSIKNITKKVFKIQPGGKVIFQGDPMATSFDVTAIYGLRADLATLDPSFQTDSYLPSTRVPVNCLIGISGNIKKMDISYDIKLPNTDENIERKVDALLYSDELKIKEIAYLLAAGSFTPLTQSEGTQTANSLWTSLASGSLTSLLNNLLSGVLNENWTIGTDLYNEGDNSDLEMDVNISTHLFNNRLTVSSNIGYKNTTNTNSNTNFTGDFNVQYKLNQSGNVILKMYNITNDSFYDQAQAPTTQGVGIEYRKEAKTFKQLFKKIKNQLFK